MAEKIVRYDADGYDFMTTALMELLNQYPELQEGEEFSFSTLEEDGGLAMYPTAGAIIRKEIRDVTDHVTQECIYPFALVYRMMGTQEKRKISVKEFLDRIGKWLEKQIVWISGEEYQLEEYPPMMDGRIIESISRQTSAYLDKVYENQSEDWVIMLQAQYTHEYDLP